MPKKQTSWFDDLIMGAGLRGPIGANTVVAAIADLADKYGITPGEAAAKLGEWTGQLSPEQAARVRRNLRGIGSNRELVEAGVKANERGFRQRGGKGATKSDEEIRLPPRLADVAYRAKDVPAAAIRAAPTVARNVVDTGKEYLRTHDVGDIASDAASLAKQGVQAVSDDPYGSAGMAMQYGLGFGVPAMASDYADMRGSSRSLAPYAAEDRQAAADRDNIDALAVLPMLGAVGAPISRAASALRRAVPEVPSDLAVPVARAKVPARVATSSRRPGAMPPADLPASPPMLGNTAYATSEAVPYVSGRHRTDITAAPESVRDAFSTRPDTVWSNDAGTDVLLDVAGVPQAPMIPFRGIYDPPGAPRESNFGWASRALFDTPEGRLSPEDAATMSAVQAVRTVGDVQGATPWTMPLFGLPRDEMNALLIPTGGRSQLKQMEDLNRLGQPYGLTDTLDIGDALIRTNFGGGAPTGEDLYQMMVAPAKASASHPVMDVKSILGPRAKPIQIGTTGDYVGFEKPWEQPEGSGAVTSLLARYLHNPRLPRARREALLEDPRVAEQFGNRFLRDEAAGMAGAPIRGDIQRAREIIAEQERLQALFEAFGRGVPLMARGGLAQMSEQAQCSCSG